MSFKKVVSVLILSAFLVQSAEPRAYSAQLKSLPKADAVLSIPAEFGKTEESFTGESGGTIIYIQDAHDSLEAQENIAKIIGDLVEHYGVKTVYEEGYEGPVPTDKYFGSIEDAKTKQGVSYFLLDKLRIGGAEFAHINRTKDFDLIGADSIRLQLENIDWYRESAKCREEISGDLRELEQAINTLIQKHFPKGLKEWMKWKSRLDHGEMELFDYVKRSVELLEAHPSDKASILSQYPDLYLLLSAEKQKDPEILEKARTIDSKMLFAEIEKLEEDLAARLLDNERDRTALKYYRGLRLLNRLNAVETPGEEYQVVKGALNELKTQEITDFIARHTEKTLVLSKRWEENIRNAIRFYELAEERDGMVEKVFSNADLQKGGSQPPVILVYGGFHKANIKEILRRYGFSYLIVTPRITKISETHHQRYADLMKLGRERFQVSLMLPKATRPASEFVGAFISTTYQSGFEDLLRQAIAWYRAAVQMSSGQDDLSGLNQRMTFMWQQVPSGAQSMGKEEVTERIKAIGRSGMQDWSELLDLMEKYPQYFDRIYLDLDETLFTSKVYLGSHQWYFDEAKYFTAKRWRLSAKKGLIEKESAERGLLQLVEPRIVEVLKEMKRLNPKLIVQGLTSRRNFMEASTKKILKSLGLEDLEVEYGAYRGKKVEAIHRDLASNEKPERGITLFIDDEAQDLAKHKLMKTIGQMGAVVLQNKKVSSFDMETSLSRFRETLTAGSVVKGVPQAEDHLIAALLLSRFSNEPIERAAIYRDPDIQRFVAAGSDKLKMAYIEAVTGFFSSSFERDLSDERRDSLLDFYYGLVSFDKELWKQAHREGKLTYHAIDRNLPFLRGRGNYELLLTPQNAYFFMEPLLDHLVTQKPDVVLLPDTAARPFTEALRYFIEKENLSTRVINFPISTGDARDTRYELTRWMKLLRGELPARDKADEALVEFLRKSGIDGIHGGDKAVIFDDGITRGHAVSMITDVVEDVFHASVPGAFVAFDYKKNIDKRTFAAFSSFRTYGEFGARDSNYHSAPGVIVRLDWEFKPDFKGVSSRRPYNPPPPSLKGEGAGGAQVLAAFKDSYEKFFHRSGTQRESRLPNRPVKPIVMSPQYVLLNAADTVHLPDEIKGSSRHDELIAELERLAAEQKGGELIKFLRTEADLRMPALGGIAAVSLIERGQKKLTELTLNRILSGLKKAYQENGLLTADEVEYYVLKGFGRAVPERDKEPAEKTPGAEDGGLKLLRARDQVSPWAVEEKTLRPRDRWLLREKNVFLYRLIRGSEDLGYVILAVLKNKAGEDTLLIEKIQPRMIHDQDVQVEDVRDLIVGHLSKNNTTIQALYTSTKIAYMAGVSESHRVRRGLSSGDFKLTPQTMDLWHEGTEKYYSKDHQAGDIGLIWRRFAPEDQKLFDSAVEDLAKVLTERPWGGKLIKDAFEVDIRRYMAYRRMHLPFNEADLLVLKEIVRLLDEQTGANKFADPKAEEFAKFDIRAQVELLKYRKLGIKPDFKQLYPRAGTAEQRGTRMDLLLGFFLENFWDGGYNLAGMKWSEIQKRFAEWGAADLLDKISAGRKGKFLERLVPGAYGRSGRSYSVTAGHRLSREDFQRFLNGGWYAAPTGTEYIIQGDEKTLPHWEDVPGDFFSSRKGQRVRFEIIEGVGVVGRDIKGMFFFREGKVQYTARPSDIIKPAKAVTAAAAIKKQAMPNVNLKIEILTRAKDLMGERIVQRILSEVSQAIDRHPLKTSDPQKVLSDFEGFIDQASGFSKPHQIQLFFDSLNLQSDGSFGPPAATRPGGASLGSESERFNATFKELGLTIAPEEMTISSGVILKASELSDLKPNDREPELTELLMLAQRDKQFKIYIVGYANLENHSNPFLRALMAEKIKVRKIQSIKQVPPELIRTKILIKLNLSEAEDRSAEEIINGIERKRTLIPLKGDAWAVTTFLKAAESALQEAGELRDEYEQSVFSRIARFSNGQWVVYEEFLDKIRDEMLAAYAISIAA